MRRRGKERRIHPRLSHNLPVKLAANGYDFDSTTQNISCVGAYCTINKYIPPFTKLSIKLSLPLVHDNSQDELHVECKGVIVRTEDEAGGGFNVAIFFNEIKPGEKNKITHYISQNIVREEQACLKSSN